MVIMAARVAKVFSLDPIAILRDGGDELINRVRVAATMVIQEDERKQNDAQQKASGGRRPRRR